MLTKSYDVFISHASPNKNVALDVVNKLEAQGIKCFIAPRDMEPGSDYASTIIEAIEQTKVTVLIFSSNADRSGYVLREINSAVLRSKTILPFRIEDITPSKSMEFYLGVTHWLNAFPKVLDSDIDMLINTIKQVCVEQHPTSPKSIVYENPVMLDCDDLKKLGYDMRQIVLETIELDYQNCKGGDFIVDEKLEGTVEDWLESDSNYPDSYSMLVAKDIMVGYWQLSIINEENFRDIISGKKTLRPVMSEFYDFGGEFFVYIGLMPIIKEYETSANYMMMLDKLFLRIVEMRQRSIFIGGIGISVYTDIVEKIIVKLGFEYRGNNVANGKIYELTPEAICANKIFANRYPAFYALYAGGHDKV